MRGEPALVVVDTASRHPRLTLAIALALIMGLLAIASRLELRSNLLELLPRDSPGFRALEHQLGRIGGRSTLLVIVSSPNRTQNERFVDDLAAKLDEARRTPTQTSRLIAYVESNSKELRAFYERNKWLYADLDDLRNADAELDHQIAIHSGLVENLDDHGSTTAGGDGLSGGGTGALGMHVYVDRWESLSRNRDPFQSGYFETADGKLVGLRMVSNVDLGNANGDLLLAETRRIVAELDPAVRYDAAMRVGFTGDIASAADEKRALTGQALGATALVVGIIGLALVAYYRSIGALVIVGLPALAGVAAAYAFAEVAFGYVNTSGAFLGAIIIGNGINYPIVLLSRYQEFRARGMSPETARREAVRNAFRAELVGACVAAVAYGSLSLTRFRGFSQFGAIGFIGMLSVWISIVPLVPATLVLVERLQPRLPRILRDRPPKLRDDGSRSWVTRWAALTTRRRPRLFLVLAAIVTVVATLPIPRYLRDPWEYDFGRLGSKQTEATGAGEWSNKANDVFGGKANLAGAVMLADTPAQVPLVKRQILENDKKDALGSMVAEVTTIDDFLPGTTEEQTEKLAVLDALRARLTDRVMTGLSAEEMTTLARVRPPDGLRSVGREDLPPFVLRRFSENDGRVGTVFYVKPRDDIIFADGHNHLRLSRTTDNVRLSDGSVVQTASRSTIFAEMLTSMRRDGPLASLVAFVGVSLVVVFASRNARLAGSVLLCLTMAATWLVGWAAYLGIRINYVNFIALPITLGIGCEYPFNVADRTRLLGGDATAAVERSAGAVLLCSFTTIVGYGSLLFSDFQALQSFGKLAVFGEAACVFAAVFVLPSILGLTRRSRDALTLQRPLSR
ncbi:MAG: MMPL family transporter [Myxococcota bacterium]|nr:MMPL family transporter [Myxococcota bacterium]